MEIYVLLSIRYLTKGGYIMDKEDRDLIHPFKFIKPGECPNCQSPMVVHDFEAITSQLNDYGEPILVLQVANRCIAKCLKCGTEIPVIRDGMRYVPFSYTLDYAVDPSTVDLKKVISEDNPFIKNNLVLKGK